MMTDKEYLRKLYRETKYDPWIQEIQPLMAEGLFAQQSTEIAIKEGSIEKKDAAAFKSVGKEMLTPEKFFRGKFIKQLNEIALLILGKQYAHVRKIPVGLLPSSELNAFASPTPAGRSVIVLNSAIIPYCGLVYKLLVSFSDWHSEHFFSREHSQEEYRHALVALAEFITTGNERPLRLMGEVIAFQSKPTFDKYISDSATMMELFAINPPAYHFEGRNFDRSVKRSSRNSGAAIAGRIVLHNRWCCRGSRPPRRRAQARVGCKNGAVA